MFFSCGSLRALGILVFLGIISSGCIGPASEIEFETTTPQQRARAQIYQVARLVLEPKIFNPGGLAGRGELRTLSAYSYYRSDLAMAPLLYYYQAQPIHSLCAWAPDSQDAATRLKTYHRFLSGEVTGSGAQNILGSFGYYSETMATPDDQAAIVTRDANRLKLYSLTFMIELLQTAEQALPEELKSKLTHYPEALALIVRIADHLKDADKNDESDSLYTQEIMDLVEKTMRETIAIIQEFQQQNLSTALALGSFITKYKDSSFANQDFLNALGQRLYAIAAIHGIELDFGTSIFSVLKTKDIRRFENELIAGVQREFGNAYTSINKYLRPISEAAWCASVDEVYQKVDAEVMPLANQQILDDTTLELYTRGWNTLWLKKTGLK